MALRRSGDGWLLNSACRKARCFLSSASRKRWPAAPTPRVSTRPGPRLRCRTPGATSFHPSAPNCSSTSAGIRPEVSARPGSEELKKATQSRRDTKKGFMAGLLDVLQGYGTGCRARNPEPRSSGRLHHAEVLLTGALQTVGVFLTLDYRVSTIRVVEAGGRSVSI